MEKATSQTDESGQTVVLSAEFSGQYADALRQVAEKHFREHLLVVVIAEPEDTLPVGFSRNPYPMKYNRDYQAAYAAGQGALGYSPENLGPKDYEEKGTHDRTVRAGHVGCLVIHDERVQMGVVRDLARAVLGRTPQRKTTGKTKDPKESETAA